MDSNLHIQIFKELGSFLGKKITEMSNAVSGAFDKTSDKIVDGVTHSLKQSQSQHTQAFTASVTKLEKAIDKIKNPTFSGEVSVDGSAFAEEFEKITEEIRKAGEGVSEQMPDLDLERIGRGLQMLVNKIDEIDNKSVVAKLDDVVDALKAIKMPAEFKIESNQLREISASGRGSIGGGGQMTARNVLNTVVSMTSANTEYSYKFPANTVSWRMKLRSRSASWNYSWITGKLAASGDGSAYISIPSNWLDSRAGVEFSNKTIYFESATASQVMEIEVNTM